MPEEEEKVSLMIYLKKELEEALARNEAMEKENTQLKQEMIRLKAQIASLRAHDHERKSLLWKKFQTNSNPEPPIKGPENVKSRSAFPMQPPPPPPPPMKVVSGSNSIRRVPEVAEFYRMLSRKNANMVEKSKSSGIDPNALPMNMIGEIENRSTHLSAIKSEVENRKEFIEALAKEVESATFKSMNDVEKFVNKVDEQLSCLVDERAVLKHFTKWPESKADALREAAFTYTNLKNLHFQVSSFQDCPKDSLSEALTKMQSLQDRLERSVNEIERTRESMIKKYRDFQIPWEWLLHSGFIGQMKISSLKTGREYMRRITREIQQNGKEDCLLQGARFAHRIHQFAGGFDAKTIDTFREMKNCWND